MDVKRGTVAAKVGRKDAASVLLPCHFSVKELNDAGRLKGYFARSGLNMAQRPLKDNGHIKESTDA